MKFAAIGAALISLAIAGSAQAQAEEGANPATAARNTGTPSGSRLLPNGQSADKVQAAKARTAKAKAAKPAARKTTLKDTASAAAPHRYPTANKPPVATVGSIRSNNDGTVHKNAPIDQVAGAGG